MKDFVQMIPNGFISLQMGSKEQLIPPPKPVERNVIIGQDVFQVEEWSAFPISFNYSLAKYYNEKCLH